MRALVAIVVLLLVGGAALGAAQDNRWGWQGTDSRGDPAEIGFQRAGTGPLFLTAGANVACPGGTPLAFGVELFDTVGVPVHADGTFAYTGGTDRSSSLETHPALQLSGRLAGTTITGTFRLTGEIIPLEGQPRCHAESDLIRFTARCEQYYCPKPVTKKPRPRVTVFPGVGIGGSALGMRGVAKLGMTESQIRALHRSRPFVSEPGHHLAYRYSNGARAHYFFSGRHLTNMALEGGIRTAAGIADRSTEAQLVRAYPRARCRTAGGFRYCSLLRGTATQGILTQFSLITSRVYAIALVDCGYVRGLCAKTFGH